MQSLIISYCPKIFKMNFMKNLVCKIMEEAYTQLVSVFCKLNISDGLNVYSVYTFPNRVLHKKLEIEYCKSGNFRGVEIFAHFAAKWSGAKIKPREYYVKMCVCVCKLVVREIKNTRYSSF